MLFSDSLPQLWLTYAGVSLIVLATGYLGIRLLPLLPRLLFVGVVAGCLWMVAPFTLPLLEPGQSYSGLAPAIVVLAVGVLQHDGGQAAASLPLLLLGAAVGAVVGLVAWRLLRRRRNDNAPRGRGDKAEASGRSEPASRRSESRSDAEGRREPTVG
ncbi:hypothetical protein [Salinicola aestuarinus]|uniref:hypothetical protein n=1 Tax=Salinicola aestuarinus TaxID=1949082 RepID=UPI000DA1F94B|nr:hypothetical protein [Salinicola aestuarinus]